MYMIDEVDDIYNRNDDLLYEMMRNRTNEDIGRDIHLNCGGDNDLYEIAQCLYKEMDSTYRKQMLDWIQEDLT